MKVLDFSFLSKSAKCRVYSPLPESQRIMQDAFLETTVCILNFSMETDYHVASLLFLSLNFHSHLVKFRLKLKQYSCSMMFSLSSYVCFWALCIVSKVLAKWMLCLQLILVLPGIACARTSPSVWLSPSTLAAASVGVYVRYFGVQVWRASWVFRERLFLRHDGESISHVLLLSS